MPAARARQVLAAVIGNALEWYDFVIFGFLTATIAHLFFPSTSEYASLLLTTATFGVGFFMRPLGAIVLGVYADRHGRKAALQMIIALMTIAIGLIAFAPTYAAIGIGAPMIIVFARLLQGFATGGEFGSATSFLIETAPPGRRGLYGSLQMVGQSVAALGGAVSGALLMRGLTPEQVGAWGWRIPFLIGLLIGPVGMWIRRHLSETDEFLRASEARVHDRDATIPRMLREHLRGVLVSFGLVVSGTTTYYVVLVYMPTFAKTQLGIDLGDAFVAQVVGLLCLTAVIPVCGWLSDRIGRKPLIVVALVSYLLLLYPLFTWVHANPTLTTLATMQALLCICIGMLFGPISTALAEQFPPGVRSTGLALAYNFAVMLFGGFAQTIVTWLIHATGSPIAGAYYVMMGAAVGLVASMFLVEERRVPNPSRRPIA
ncbi:MAG: MFS transporter [Betaproteobacteria bacterium]|nr:MFS transporter [Betaproteobacteria bacterium]